MLMQNLTNLRDISMEPMLPKAAKELTVICMRLKYMKPGHVCLQYPDFTSAVSLPQLQQIISFLDYS